MEAMCTQVSCWVLTGHCLLALPYLAVPSGRKEGDDASGPQRLLFTPVLGQAGPRSCDTQQPACRKGSSRTEGRMTQPGDPTSGPCTLMGDVTAGCQAWLRGVRTLGLGAGQSQSICGRRGTTGRAGASPKPTGGEQKMEGPLCHLWAKHTAASSS